MSKKWECIDEHEFDGDIVITDPCYIDEGADWDEIEAWGREHGLISRTFYGDWGCTVYETEGAVGCIANDSKKIGTFCADAGMVCVLHLEDVLSRNPGFMEWAKNHEWCLTIIKGFKGTIRLMTMTTKWQTADGRSYDDVELHVRGDGIIDGKPISFESIQTSL